MVHAPAPESLSAEPNVAPITGSDAPDVASSNGTTRPSRERGDSCTHHHANPTLLLQIQQHIEGCDWDAGAQFATTLSSSFLHQDSLEVIARGYEDTLLKRFSKEDSQAAAPSVATLCTILRFIDAHNGRSSQHGHFSHLAEGLQKDFEAIPVQVLSTLSQAFTEVKRTPGTEYLTKLSSFIFKRMKGYSLQQISYILNSFAAFGHHPGQSILEQTVHIAQHCLITDSSELGADTRAAEFSTLVCALVILGPADKVPQLVGPVVEGLGHARCRWDLENLARLFWGLASAGCISKSLLNAVSLQSPGKGDLSTQVKLQLAAAYLAVPAIDQHIPQNVLIQCIQARRNHLSELHNVQAAREIVAVLKELGLEPVEGLLLQDGLYRIDIALVGMKVAFALDEKDCFSTNIPEQPLGRKTLEWHLLSRMKWQVVSLPIQTWRTLEGQAERTEFVRKALQKQFANVEEMQPPASRTEQREDSAAHSEAMKGGKEASKGNKEDDKTWPAPNRPTPERFDSIRSGGLNLGTTPERLDSVKSSGQGSLIGESMDGSTELSRSLPPLTGQGSSASGNSGGRATATSSVEQSSSYMLSNRMSGLSLGGTPSLGDYHSGSVSSQDALAALYNNMGTYGQAPPMGSAALPATANQLYLDQLALANRYAGLPMLHQQQQPPALSQADNDLPDLKADLGMSAGVVPSGPAYPSNYPMGLPLLPGQMSQELPRVPVPQMTGLGQTGPYMQVSDPVSDYASKALGVQPQGDLRHLWQMVTQQPDPTFELPKEGVSVSELKRVIELLPLETSAVNAVAPRLAMLDPKQFAALLTELARDNHAFRAWQLFDWVRALPEDNMLQKLCDSNTYTTMISLCGPWQQVRRALSLVADMRARSLDCGIQAYSALLNAAVKCGEVELAVDVYRQMGQEGMKRERPIFQTMVDVFVKMGRHAEALGVLEDMKTAGQPAEVQLYNLIVLSCTKLNNPRAALDVYQRMAKDGVQPNTKTFTALISSVGKMSTIEQAMDIINELLSHESEPANLIQTYSALMSACEKAGQWDLAVALFDKMSTQGCKPDVSIFNSMIAACAHGGQYIKAQMMFHRMAEHDCAADAVTYANLIRAYKKGGQWCHALETFEAMQRSGCSPHAAVFSSIIDVLWQTGIAWAQAKALRLFTSAVETGSLTGAAESSKKGTLKVDLQALTVGVAVLSMASWLTSARQAILQDHAGSLDSSRKLAVVNGLGEHSRAQGHSAAVKEAVGAGLLGCKAPFRLVQDHSRSGRLEASSLALRKWLFSDAFDAYLNLLQGGAEIASQQLMSTADYLEKEIAEQAKCQKMFARIQTYEKLHPVSFKILHSHPGPYLAVRKQLVGLTLHYAAALQLSQETAHTALALMDRCAMSGIHLAEHLQGLLVCACLRVAALQESSFVPAPLAFQALTHIPAVHLEQMESTIAATLNNDTECISAVHCLKIYLQRLNVDLSNGETVRLAAGCAFALATQALAELPILQFPPSLTAAAVLVAARKAQGSVPFWPSVLNQLTGYTEATTPAFASAIGHAERLCTKLCSGPESSYLLSGTGVTPAFHHP